MASHKIRLFNGEPENYYLGPFDDGKKDKRRKDIAGKVGKEINDRRDEYVTRTISPINLTICTVAGITQKT